MYTLNTGNGQVTFNPDASFSGTATAIAYTVEDKDGNTSNSATITVTVQAAPIAVNDTGSTAPDTNVVLNILSNDSDADGTLAT